MTYLSYIRKIIQKSQSRKQAVQALLCFLHAYDPYTAQHGERVGFLASSIAYQLGLKDQQIEYIYEAGCLHDIGKLMIPLSALHKTEGLTHIEYTRVKKHPEYGAQLLYKFLHLHDLIPAILYHHERFDGTGYPQGLKGAQIPLSARIIAVADTFDAMTSTRTYRKALSYEYAQQELLNSSHTQLDSQIVGCALSLLTHLVPH